MTDGSPARIFFLHRSRYITSHGQKRAVYNILLLWVLWIPSLLSCQPSIVPSEGAFPTLSDSTSTFTPEIEITATATPASVQNKRGVHYV